MGFFSWKCAVSGYSIPAPNSATGGNLPEELSHVVLVLPDNKVISGTYDGYGGIEQELSPKTDIYDAIAPYYFGRPDANREDVFSDKKYITTPDGGHTFTIDLFNYEAEITDEHFDSAQEVVTGVLGKTMNQLVSKGYKITSDFYLLQDGNWIKLVRFDHYHGQTFEELPRSERCPSQGYFYDSRELCKLRYSLNKKAR